jgi:hypothetical protein
MGTGCICCKLCIKKGNTSGRLLDRLFTIAIRTVVKTEAAEVDSEEEGTGGVIGLVIVMELVVGGICFCVTISANVC